MACMKDEAVQVPSMILNDLFTLGEKNLNIDIERRVTGTDEVKNEPCLCIESDQKAFDAVSSGQGARTPEKLNCHLETKTC